MDELTPEQPESTLEAESRKSSEQAVRPTPAVQPRRRPVQSVAELPSYSRSLLQVRVPVIVTLAAKKQPLSEILSLGPGAIIQFQKSCDQMLDIEVGQLQVAQGEAVKVGEKFGIRVTSMTLPEGDYVSIGRPRT